MREKEVLSQSEGSDSRIFSNSNSSRHVELFNKAKLKKTKLSELRKLLDKVKDSNIRNIILHSILPSIPTFKFLQASTKEIISYYK